MDIQVRGHSTFVTATLRAHVERRLAFSLGRFEPRIRRVLVRLSDVNGHHSGGGKSCRIAVELFTSDTIRVEHTDADFFAAAARAADSSSRSVARAIHDAWDTRRRVRGDEGVQRAF